MTELSDVYEGELDDDALAQLLFDVGAAAQLLAVVIRSRGERAGAPQPPDLAHASEALRERGESVQLRYVADGVEWWDTVMRSGVGRYRIVRTRPPSAF